MKNIKLLNKKILSILIIFILFLSSNTNAEDEPADIWDLEKKVEDENKESGTIVQEIQKGYIMKDRLLRPSLVAVSKKPEKNEEKNGEKLKK